MFCPSARLSRREVLQVAGSSAFGALIAQHWWASGALAQAQSGREGMPPLNRFPRMMQDYYLDRMRAFHVKRLQRLEALQTKADAEAYVQSCRERIRESFGPEPERTPLNPRITGTVERDGYKIENLIFESRPGFLVTANLYIPTNVEGKRPGVVGTCGHSTNGKMAEAYQSFAQGLARQGYVCLIYDPIGQGERFQYVDEELHSHVGAGVREHLLAGNQQFLVGEFLGMWRAWDGIRALDYLQTREEVDPEQIGVTGNSGGGTMTTWLCGVEQRWNMAAPSCFVTSFVRNLQNELPADTEQCPPRALALGLDHEDFLAALAPKPVIILAKEKDYFDARGSEEAYGRLKRLYSLLGAEENIGLFIGPTYHGYSQENREAMYRWFNGVTRSSDATSEPELTIEKDETLWCAPNGQVSELDSKTVPQFTAQLAEDLARQRGEVAPPELNKRIEALLGDVRPADKPDYYILRPRGSRRYPLPSAATYVVEVERGVQAIVTRLYAERHYSRPPQSDQPALLYVSHHSSDAELRENEPLKEALAAAGDTPVYAVDVRGIGESQPNTTNENSYLSPYGSDYFYAAHGIMLDDPYPLQRTRDVLAVLNWLKSIGHPRVHLWANGWGSIAGTLAATIDPAVKQVTLQHALTSFDELARAEEYDWPLSSMIPDVLKQFDLPDCYRALEAKGLKQIDPWGPQTS
jgi:dienelactone hydrolase